MFLYVCVVQAFVDNIKKEEEIGQSIITLGWRKG